MSYGSQVFNLSHIHMLFASIQIILLLQLTPAKQHHCLIEWPQVTTLIDEVKINLTHVLHTVITPGTDLFDN